ncbi:SDR family NAD(P)-dependent oxidoreductase [Nocardia xishanensis]|uniref:SDR family NAD(P)-dependent oxidoreductase n=1 Tax=Nocardia xishanensis TaxID=238964 RepID=UPI000832EBE2|nr:SDR family NAD(P)-dependent oxidoreductase [Nocardia xishanensis]
MGTRAVVGGRPAVYAAVVNGGPAALFEFDGQVIGVVCLEATADGVAAIHLQVDPGKLERITRQWAAAGPHRPFAQMWCARTAMPYLGPISASKAALESLSKAARVELAPWGIPVTVVEPGAVETTIFAKAESNARKALTMSDGDRVELYSNQLAAVGAALAGQKAGPVDRVVKQILRAAEARRPKECYVAGSDARMLRLLSRLPFRLRDRVLARALGLARVDLAAGALR